MISESVGVAGGLIVLTGHIPLYYGIVRKTIKPSFATWSMWSVLGSSIVVSQVLAGKEDPWGMLAAACGTIIATILLFFYGEKVWGRYETKCLVLAVIGYIVWIFSGPAIAQIAFLISLTIAGGPTIRNVWSNPKVESSLVWGIFTFGFFLTMISIQDWTSYVNWIQPVVSVLLNLLIFSLTLRR